MTLGAFHVDLFDEIGGVFALGEAGTRKEFAEAANTDNYITLFAFGTFLAGFFGRNFNPFSFFHFFKFIRKGGVKVADDGYPEFFPLGDFV